MGQVVCGCGRARGGQGGKKAQALDRDKRCGRMRAVIDPRRGRVAALEAEVRELHRLAVQRHTAQYCLANAPAARAVDGSAATTWAANSCTHTAAQTDPRWRVDLGPSQRLPKVPGQKREETIRHYRTQRTFVTL